MQSIDGQFQVRPWKEFTAARGLARLETLPLLMTAVPSGYEEPEGETPEQLRNINDFKRGHRKEATDPSLTHWSAGVRLGNFTIDANKLPLCVCNSGPGVASTLTALVLNCRSAIRPSRSGQGRKWRFG